ncbi:hypothetical protein ACR77J_07630 [Tissierella praeacuta]|uniref:hypothetical protein n=1 Tax=Tissierella praeacuta TaxID=43131 RepID=UPI003DA5FCF2
MTGVEIYKFIKPHLGSIKFSGSHEVDVKRLNNYKIYDELINCLLEDLDQSFEGSKDRYESSAKQINMAARNILVDKLYWLEDYCSDFR